jgi:hypothetical protein
MRTIAVQPLAGSPFKSAAAADHKIDVHIRLRAEIEVSGQLALGQTRSALPRDL